jgi:hypothetical protein
MTDSVAETEVTAISAEMTRDETAQFTMIFGETTFAMSGFKPMASALGKGYRQDYQDRNGDPHADLVVLLPPVTGVPGQTVVRIARLAALVVLRKKYDPGCGACDVMPQTS